MKCLSLFLVALLSLPLVVTPAYASSSEFEEDSDSYDELGDPRFILERVTAPKKLLQKKSNKKEKFLSLTLDVRYEGPEYSFEDLSAPIVGTLVCSFGNAGQDAYGGFKAKYRYEQKVEYKNNLPLQDGDRLSFDVLIPISQKNVSLLTSKSQNEYNVCFINMNMLSNFESIGADLSKPNWARDYGFTYRAYSVKMVRNALQIQPKTDWGY